MKPRQMLGHGLSEITRVILAAIAIGAVTAGCSTDKRRVTTEYRTIAPDLRRDTDIARQENARAVALIEKNDWVHAEEVLKSALEADVTFGPAHNNLGKVYYHQGKLYLAAWEFQYAIKAMPYQPEPRNNLGLVLEASGKLNDAVQCYDEALNMEADNPTFCGNDARARLRRGDRDAKVQELLSKVVAAGESPRWVEWAKEQLMLLQSRAPHAQLP